MKKYYLIFVLTLIVLISGCTQTSQNIVSNKSTISNETKPYRGQTSEEVLQDLQSKYEDTSNCVYWDCFTKVAIHTNNYKACEEIQGDKRERSYCYQTVAIKTGNYSLCESIENLGSETIYDKNYCKALASRDIYYCDKVSVEELKDYCSRNLLMDTAAKTGNLSICEQLGEEHLDYKNSCFIRVALYSYNEEMCNNIPENDILANKVAHINCRAMVIGDSSICESFDNVVNRDNCYNKVAFVLKDISICDKIERDFIRLGSEPLLGCVEQIFLNFPFECVGCNDLREEIYSNRVTS